MSLNKLERFRQKYMMTLTLAAMIFALLFVFFSPRIIVIIPAGHVGVLFRPLGGGTDLKLELGEGANLVLPWNDVTVYDARLQTVNHDFDVISKDGLALKTSIEVRYRVNRELIPLVHKHLGHNYLNVMLTPEIASHARAIVAEYTAEDFYSNKREEVQQRIYEQTAKGILSDSEYNSDGVAFVEIDDILVKNIALPAMVAASIERKIEQYHRQLEFDFRIQSELKEAKRKEIEGQGVARLFAQIGQRDLQAYLRLASIQAMLKLAESKGSKVVVVADPRGGVPVIVNPDSGVASTGSHGIDPTSQASQVTPALK